MKDHTGASASDGFDPFDLNKPHAKWEQLRKEEPIFFHEPTNYWVVTRYDDIKAIFDDYKTFSSENAQKPVRAMCEANADQLIPSLDHALDLLNRARAALAEKGSVAELVDAGHAARVRFESFSRPDIVTIAVGEENWREELAAAGRAGAVIRSALPTPGNRR